MDKKIYVFLHWLFIFSPEKQCFPVTLEEASRSYNLPLTGGNQSPKEKKMLSQVAQKDNIFESVAEVSTAPLYCRSTVTFIIQCEYSLAQRAEWKCPVGPSVGLCPLASSFPHVASHLRPCGVSGWRGHYSGASKGPWPNSHVAGALLPLAQLGRASSSQEESVPQPAVKRPHRTSLPWGLWVGPHTRAKSKRFVLGAKNLKLKPFGLARGRELWRPLRGLPWTLMPPSATVAKGVPWAKVEKLGRPSHD